jgi:hypothetical protein
MEEIQYLEQLPPMVVVAAVLQELLEQIQKLEKTVVLEVAELALIIQLAAQLKQVK